MFQPKIPTMPQPSGLVIPPAVVQPTTITPGTPVSAPAAAPEPSRPVVQLTPGTAVALVGAGTAVVLVVGTVLVSLLLAVAVTSASVAVCAVVLRSLIASDAKRR
ncbi:SpdD-like protein [Streptomyces sp. R527F]|uniref:SpdD-like protein n=1 Tax=Streptomyces sp. R527F TaxID=1664033 RepID=UPI001F183C6A|nr:SpdD-like protein [Streptomyces sp. R527F]UIZ14161.1 SpdD-like protein [Streptomyces sp. R527F]